mgnify:CR=1 FL=1
MSWLHIEQEFALQSDLDTINRAIEHQKQVLEYLYTQKGSMKRQLEHIMYRNRIERPTKVNVETKGEIG